MSPIMNDIILFVLQLFGIIFSFCLIRKIKEASDKSICHFRAVRSILSLLFYC